MTDLSAFPITKKWPAQHPERLQLYSLPTPNGIKVAVMLEETGLPNAARLLRGRRSGRDQRFPARDAGPRGIRRTARGRERAGHTQAGLTR
jgi:hypothetical protein